MQTYNFMFAHYDIMEHCDLLIALTNKMIYRSCALGTKPPISIDSIVDTKKGIEGVESVKTAKVQNNCSTCLMKTFTSLCSFKKPKKTQ